MASSPRRVGRLCGPSTEPDVSSATPIQPTSAHHGPGESDGAAYRRLRCCGVRESVSDAFVVRRRSAGLERTHGAGQGGLRGRRVHTRSVAKPRQPAARASRVDRRGLERPLRRARRNAGRDVRDAVRESRCRSRRHASSSARTDLRVPLRSADSSARAGFAARVPRPERSGPVRRFDRSRNRRREAHALRDRRGGRVRACLRPLLVRGVGGAETGCALLAGTRASGTARVRVRDEDGAA